MTSLAKNAVNTEQTQTASKAANLWQHPFVDVFKHYKLLPAQDWRANKKQGSVTEEFAKEIGRKTLNLSGTISANNFVQLPHPNCNVKSLALTGRYLYLQVKATSSSSPFSFHFDLNMAERSTGIRISASNLYKTVSTQNGFVLQVPLNLDLNRWTVAVFDLYELLNSSGLLPSNYIIQGSYNIKSLTLCACSTVRGVFTSDNLYDFVTLPPDMRFKFSFDINRWPEQFAWLELPADIQPNTKGDPKKQRTHLISEKQGIAKKQLTQAQKAKMDGEISEMLQDQKYMVAQQPAAPRAPIVEKAGNAGDDLLSANERLGFKPAALPTHAFESAPISHAKILQSNDMKRSPKLQQDPVMELRHIIGYSPDACLSLLWSKVPSENVVIFSSGGCLIAQDVENDTQKRFFFGHSEPIVCFDASQDGKMLASAQQGKNSIIRIWDYQSAKCLSMVTMPVTSIKQVSFAPDGRSLTCVGKDSHNKELIVVWDIARIFKGEKPEVLAKQTSDFNILTLKMSPIDSKRLVSCGKENIRFWRLKDGGNIRGSAVVLNHHARNTVFTSLDFEWGAKGSASGGPDCKENESLKRVYVASKAGMVF